jgi:hypothetical protein
MIYQIGGPPRIGKSTLAKILLQKNNVPFVPTDAVFHTLKDTPPTPIVDDKLGHQQKAIDFYPFLRELIKHLHWSGTDFCVEGDAFLPEQIDQLIHDPEFEKIHMRCVFLGMAKSSEQVNNRSEHLLVTMAGCPAEMSRNLMR